LNFPATPTKKIIPQKSGTAHFPKVLSYSEVVAAQNQVGTWGVLRRLF